MRIFKILWNSKTKAGTWISFEAKMLGKPFMFHFSRSGRYTQWFCFANVFPIAILKNNTEFQIGNTFAKQNH